MRNNDVICFSRRVAGFFMFTVRTKSVLVCEKKVVVAEQNAVNTFILKR